MEIISTNKIIFDKSLKESISFKGLAKKMIITNVITRCLRLSYYNLSQRDIGFVLLKFFENIFKYKVFSPLTFMTKTNRSVKKEISQILLSNSLLVMNTTTKL